MRRKCSPDLVYQGVVDADLVAERAQVPRHRLCCRLRIAVGERCDRRVDAVGAGLDTLEIDEGCKAGHAMAVQLERNVADHLLDRRHQRADAVDGEQPTRVLEPDGIDLAAFHQVLRRFHVKLVGVNRRQAIGERTESLDAQRARHIDRGQHVVDIVEAVERAHLAEAVGNQPFDPQGDDVVGHDVEADQVLRARERAQRRMGDASAHQPHPFPRVLLEIANADVELNGAGEIDALKARLVHLLGDRQHVRRRHAGRPQALVGVPQRGVDDWDFAHGHS